MANLHFFNVHVRFIFPEGNLLRNAWDCKMARFLKTKPQGEKLFSKMIEKAKTRIWLKMQVCFRQPSELSPRRQPRFEKPTELFDLSSNPHSHECDTSVCPLLYVRLQGLRVTNDVVCQGGSPHTLALFSLTRQQCPPWPFHLLLGLGVATVQVEGSHNTSFLDHLIYLSTYNAKAPGHSSNQALMLP